jgi:hypothetical protein
MPEDALRQLIIETHVQILAVDANRQRALKRIRENATYLARNYADLVARAQTGVPASLLELNLSNIERELAEAQVTYRTTGERLAELNTLFQKLLECSTFELPDDIQAAAR